MRSFKWKACTEAVCHQEDREGRQLRSLEEEEWAGLGMVVGDQQV